MISALIIDDEQDARENIRLLLNTFSNEVHILGEADSIDTGVQLINKIKPEMVFLDIELGDQTAFELLDQIKFNDFFLVFTTGHSEFAAKAFRYNAIDYLLKPINPDHLIAAIEKIKKRNPVHQLSAQLKNMMDTTDHKLTIRSRDSLTIINLKDIIRIKGDGNYSHFFLQNGEHILATKNLKFFEKAIQHKYFLRVHQSYIVNFEFLRKILYEDGTYIITTDGEKTPVSRANRERVSAFIKDMF